jgi:hypothetical protein
MLADGGILCTVVKNKMFSFTEDSTEKILVLWNPVKHESLG